MGGGFRGSSAPRGRMGSGFVSRPAPGFGARPGPGFVSRPGPGFVSRPVGRFGPAPVVRSGPAFHSRAPVVANRNGVFVTTRPFFHNRFHSHHFHNHVFFNSCGFNAFDPFFCGNVFGSPFFGSPFIGGLPFYSYPLYSDYSYPSQPPPQQPEPVAENADNRELAAQVQELSDEIQAMRDEQRVREENRNNVASSSSTQNQETILVFRDGHRISVRSYAITDGTVWVLDPNAAHKYALADLDPAATEKANAQNGVEFRLPTPREKR